MIVGERGHYIEFRVLIGVHLSLHRDVIGWRIAPCEVKRFLRPRVGGMQGKGNNLLLMGLSSGVMV